MALGNLKIDFLDSLKRVVVDKIIQDIQGITDLVELNSPIKENKKVYSAKRLEECMNRKVEEFILSSINKEKLSKPDCLEKFFKDLPVGAEAIVSLIRIKSLH